jgi:hypothetical protein
MHYDGKNIIAKADGKTADIIEALIKISPRGVDNVKPYVNDLFNFTGNAFKDAVMIAAFIRNNVKYIADNYENQNIQLPGRLLKNKFGDCKSFSLLFYSLMTAAGHKCGYRFASYRKNKIPTHVYNWFVDDKKNFYTFDTCVHHLNESKRYTYIKDMNVNYLTGYPETDYLSGKAERQARRKKRREEGKGLFQGVKKIALAVPRQAFRGLISLNVRGIATRLSQAMAKDPKRIKELWQKFGGKEDKLLQSINTGKSKRPLLGKGKGVNGADYDYLGEVEVEFLGEPTTAAALLASASAILIPFKKLLDDLGIKKTEGEDIITPEEEREAEASGNKIKNPNFKASDDENESKTSATGFKPSPLLIGGAIGAVALIYILTKKKK